MTHNMVPAADPQAAMDFCLAIAKANAAFVRPFFAALGPPVSERTLSAGAVLVVHFVPRCGRPNATTRDTA